ncbi:hypothetical protein AB0I91_40060 [Actinosynnema sp. NPDC049800]
MTEETLIVDGRLPTRDLGIAAREVVEAARRPPGESRVARTCPACTPRHWWPDRPFVRRITRATVRPIACSAQRIG